MRSFRLTGEDVIHTADKEQEFLDNYTRKIDSLRLGDNLTAISTNTILSNAAQFIAAAHREFHAAFAHEFVSKYLAQNGMLADSLRI